VGNGLQCLGALLILGHCGSAMAVAGPADSLVLALRADVSSDAALVRLGELLDFSGGDAGLQQRVAAVELQLDCLPGQTERITRDDVAALIALRVPEAADALRWSGKSSFARIHLKGQPVDLVELTRRSQAELEAWLAPRFDQYQVEPVAAPEAVAPAMARDEVATIRPFAGEALSRTPIWVELGRPGESSRRAFPIWFAVQSWTKVPVAAHDISTGARLTPDEVTSAVVDIAALGARLLLADGDMAGSIATGPIRKGEALTRDRFRQARQVTAGDEVRLRVQSGALRVEVRGVALESGNAGQRVRVRNSGSGEVVAANVAGPGVVEVTP